MHTKVLWFAAMLQLLIEFRVSSQEPDEICGRRIFTEPTGVINFTALRFAASRNSTCNYRIEVGEDNFVSLKFLYFDLPTYLDFCNRDWVTISCITDEISETLGRKSPLLCGQTKWSSALKLSECPVLSVEIVFSSDLIFDRKGFQLQYEISPTVRGNTSDENAIPEIECGETFLTNQSGAIVLPNNPNITRAKLNCTYTISPSEPDMLISLITLDVSYIDLLTLTDDIDGCEQDHLQIRCSDEDEQDSDSSGCAIFSSDSFTSPVYRGCLTLEITLHSDSYDPRETRLIKYDMTVEYEDDDTFDHGENAVCGNSTYKGQTGNVTSPHFPLAHPDNLNCIYRIAVGKQNALSLKFFTFNLEGSAGSCSLDWITITCVFNSTPNFLNAARLCGRKESSFGLKYWNCSSVYLQFRTDGSVSWGGFNIQYSLERRDSINITGIECGRTEFNTSDGVITFPYNSFGYISQINCTYRVLANATSNFHLNISSLNLPRIYSQIGRCIQFLCEGDNTMTINLCDSFYSISGSPEIVLYSCQTLKIFFASNFFELQDSYRVPFKVIPSDGICGEKSFSESNGTISFPHIYSSYHPNTKCNYTIRGGKNTTISIAFARSPYRYPDHRYCYDKITMFCLNSPNWNPYAGKRFCSQLRWPSVMHFFNCSTLLIAFSSLSYYANTVGFSLNYTVSMGEIKEDVEDIPKIPCGGSLSTLSGSFNLPTLGGVPIASINCVYNISLNSIRKGSISLNFASMSNAFDYNSDHRAVNLTILCSSDVDSAEINGTKSLTFGGGDLPRTSAEFSFSVCDSIRLSIQSSSYYPEDYRYMSFRIKNTECGNVSFDGSTGNVMSPLFPLPYGKGLNCAYYIEVGDENFITLQFLTFSLSGTSRDTPMMPSYHYRYHYSADTKFGEDRSSDVYRYDSCYYDHLTIRCLFNGSQTMSDSKYLNRVLCGNKTVTAKIFGCQALRLEFITGDSGSSRMPGFNIHYHIQDANNSDVHCGNNSFDEPSGVIASPDYPDHYPNGLNCTYAIKAGQNKSALIEVLFLDLQPASYRYIDGRQLYICTGDWLEFHCSNEDATFANHLKNRRFCGHQRPFTMLLRGCEHAIIYFSTDSTVALNGFRIRYKIYSEDDECGNTVFSNTTGIITSPGYPGPYPHRINCIYYIEVGSNNSLSLQFSSFDVGYVYGYHYYHSNWPSQCLNDFIRITCSSRDSRETPFTSQYLDKQLCGKKYSFSAKFKRCNQYAVEFFSGGNYSKSGFKLHYTIKTPDEECGKTVFSNSTGIITSPGYPGQYPQGVNCNYYIEVGRNNSLTLQLPSFEVGYIPYYNPYNQWPSQCPNDWIRINCSSRDSTEAPFTSQYLNKKLCGQRYSFTATFKHCNQYVLEFFSGGEYSRSGFRFLYTINKLGEECGKTVFSNSTGIIASPGYPALYPPGIVCNYYIEVGSSNSLSLQILSFEVGYYPYYNQYHTPSQCLNDWIRINCSSRDSTEAPFTSQYLNKKLCGQRYSFTAKFKRCNQYAVEFFSGGNYSRSGFQFLYKIIKPEDECGRTEFSNSTGVITSPGFPNYYGHHLNCTYYIDIGSKLLVLSFTHFDIGYNHYTQHCPSDWLQITCVSRRTDVSMVTNENIDTKLCGQRYNNFNVTLDGCSLAAIQFLTNESHTRPGFRIQYEIIKSGYCGYSSNNFTDAEGTIVSPYLLLRRRLQPTTCNCLISAQQMSTISLAITAIATSVSCTANWLSIKCLDDRNSLSYSPKLCGAGYLYEKVVLPSCSSVQLIYPSTSYVIEFVISYRVAGPEEVCGKSLFTEPTGYISFPKFSPKYKTKFNCSYSVSVGIYNSISFELSSFVDNDENNETSPNDWISIFCHGNNDTGQNRITHNEGIQSTEPMTLSFTNCSTVDIVFHSENQATDGRFNVSYTIHSNYITKVFSPTSSSATTTSSSASTTSSTSRPTSSSVTSASLLATSSSVTSTPLLATTISSSTSKFKCPKECIVYLNKTVFECPTNPSDQTTTETSTKSFVKTGSFGVLITFIVLLIVASLVALTVVYLRRRGAKPREDEDTLTLGDSEFETPDSQKKWRRWKFNLWSFIPFRFKSRGNNDRQKGLVPLEPMASSLSRAGSEQSIQSNPYVVSSDRNPILE